MRTSRILFFSFAIFICQINELSATPRKEPILDGTTVPASDFPAVALLSIGSDGLCTGTLISSRFILTAAHCFFDEKNKRSGGDGEVTAVLGGAEYVSSKIHIHPAYRSRSNACVEGETDAAIVELSREVSGISPIPLLENPLAIGASVVLAGFGTQGTGNSGENDTLPADGFINFGSTVVEGFGDDPPKQNSGSSYFYWTFNPGESNTGSGDSGGPAFYDVDDVRYLAGITCGGTDNAGFDTVSFQTRTDLMLDWIQSIAGITPNGTPAGFSTLRTQNASIGKTFAYNVPVTGSPNISLSASGLPPGLRLLGKAIKGKPSVKGFYSVKLKASNSFGEAEKSLDVIVSGFSPVLVMKKALLQFDYDEADQDFLGIDGTITVESKFKPKKSVVIVRIGKFSKRFKLDGNGQSIGGGKSFFDVEGSMKSGAFTSSKVKFFLTLEKVPLFDELATLGFPDSASASANEKVSLPLSVTINGVEASTTSILVFKTSDARWRIAK